MSGQNDSIVGHPSGKRKVPMRFLTLKLMGSKDFHFLHVRRDFGKMEASRLHILLSANGTWCRISQRASTLDKSLTRTDIDSRYVVTGFVSVEMDPSAG